MIRAVEIFDVVKAKMDPKDISNHMCDMYLRVNSISKDIVDRYEFKSNVTVFRDAIDGAPWYEIPFVYPYREEERRRNNGARI